MPITQVALKIKTRGQGLWPITQEIRQALTGLVAETQSTGQAPDQADADARPGLLNIFIQHTSASLLIQENADPSAKADLEEFIDRLAPENQSWHRHLDEGSDDTVSHMKSAITATSLTIPAMGDKLLLGTWQGIYLWEHRRASHTRTLILTLTH